MRVCSVCVRAPALLYRCERCCRRPPPSACGANSIRNVSAILPHRLYSMLSNVGMRTQACSSRARRAGLWRILQARTNARSRTPPPPFPPTPSKQPPRHYANGHIQPARSLARTHARSHEVHARESVSGDVGDGDRARGHPEPDLRPPFARVLHAVVTCVRCACEQQGERGGGSRQSARACASTQAGTPPASDRGPVAAKRS